jgi:hypothetical protein
VPYLKHNGHKKPRRSLLHWLLWWRIDQEELDKQLVEYASLKITQSAKGQSFLLLIFSAFVTAILVVFFNYDAQVISLFTLVILGYFIYKGQQWAIVGAMILWTCERFYLIYEGIRAHSGTHSSSPNLIIHWIWWGIYMRVFFLALKVERIRTKVSYGQSALVDGVENATLRNNIQVSAPRSTSAEEEALNLEGDKGTASPLGAIVVRLCRVLYVVCYLLTLLVTAALSWPTPSIDNALVVCRDGTSWDAARSGIRFSGTDLHGPRKLLCGLCTKRASDGKSYRYCDDADLVQQEEGYSLKNVQYVWNPSIIESITTLIRVAVVALFALEVMRMTSAYIFFGKPGKPFWWP